MYFGDLGWRSNGSLGHGRHWTYDNDTGPDDANHDRDGICVIAGPGVPAGRREDLAIYDIAPTILARAGLPADADARPRPRPAQRTALKSCPDRRPRRPAGRPGAAAERRAGSLAPGRASLA